MTSRQWFVSLWVAALLLAGCTTTPTGYLEEWQLGSARKMFAEKHGALARDYESKGAIRLALQEWRAISAVVPEAKKPPTEIERLQQVISLRMTEHQRQAEAALAKSDYANAQQQLLKMLALQPDNWEAISGLKKLEVKTGYARLARAPKVSSKIVQRYKTPATGSSEKALIDVGDTQHASGSVDAVRVKLPPSADNAEGENNLDLALQFLSKKQYDAALKYFQLAQKFKEAPEDILNEHMAHMRSMLAEQHYAKGVNSFRMANYDRAVSEFKKALEYDPQHQKARLYLGSASEMQTRIAP